jgi:hypothetical protein
VKIYGLLNELVFLSMGWIGLCQVVSHYLEYSFLPSILTIWVIVSMNMEWWPLPYYRSVSRMTDEAQRLSVNVSDRLT